MIFGSSVVTVLDDGVTTGRRIRISRQDDENARCKGLRASGQHRDFSHFRQQPTTPSTFNAISFQQARTEPSGPWPCRRGAKSSPPLHDSSSDTDEAVSNSQQRDKARAGLLCLQEVNAQRAASRDERRFLALDRLFAGGPYETYHRATRVRPEASPRRMFIISSRRMFGSDFQPHILFSAAYLVENAKLAHICHEVSPLFG